MIPFQEGGFFYLHCPAYKRTREKKKKIIICIPLFLPGFSHQEGRGACMNCDCWAAGRSEHPASPGHLRAPQLARKHRAHIPVTCRPGSPQEPSGVPTWCIYIRGGRGEVRPWSAALHTWGSQSGDARQGAMAPGHLSCLSHISAVRERARAAAKL